MRGQFTEVIGNELNVSTRDWFAVQSSFY